MSGIKLEMSEIWTKCKMSEIGCTTVIWEIFVVDNISWER